MVGEAPISDTAALRKARGAFFTPTELTAFLTGWALRSPLDRVLEPSCGEAAFLVASAECLRAGGTVPGADQLVGVEVHAPSANKAQRLLEELGFQVTVRAGDFFETEPSPTFDAVLGNPPYVRYQGWSGTARARSQEAALSQGVRLPGLASSWAAFLVHASAFLKPDGRLGLVLPAELLSVNYAGPVRRFLLDRFAHVALILFEERVFPGVLEEVVLVLAEGTGPTDHIQVSQLSDAASLGDLTSRKFSPPKLGGKWTPALLPDAAAEVYASVADGQSFEALLEWGDPDLGIVTGRNSYFALTASQAAELDLGASELLRLSPPGSRHLRGLTFTLKTWEEMAKTGARVYLFYPDADRPSKAARSYIAEGERLGVHEAYKCRVRAPWWRVPLVPRPDLFLTYMNHDTPRLVANRAGILPLNSVHGLRLAPRRRQLGMDLLPMAMLNSVTLLGAELVGRSYGGGILKLEPKEADNLPVPSRSVVEAAADDLRAMRPQLAQHLRHADLTSVAKLVDRVLLREHMGLRHADLQRIRSARDELFARRTARNGA